MSRKIEVRQPGPFATIQDLGRPGLAALGVGRSGAADRAALRLANRLVGNPEGNAAIEATFGGLVLGFACPALVALTGAACDIDVGGRAAAMNTPVRVRAGDELRLASPATGLRTYLAVRGGIDVPPVLGARATDTLGKLGPPPLSTGMTLPIGARMLDYPAADLAPQSTFPSELTLRVTAGPRLDWFAFDSMDLLMSAPHEVTADVDRIGIRLSGPALRRIVKRELPPEACVLGALQVPPSGLPILFLADHPVTGGYPVAAVVDEEDVDLAAQARPGTLIRFVARRGENRRPSAK